MQKEEYNNSEDFFDMEEELDVENTENECIYPMKDLKIDKGFYTVFELKRKFDSNNRIILDSNFQRGNVWNTKQKIELIESVLMGLPLPIFYFNQDKLGNLIVIDGRQRLTALFEFIDNKFVLNKMKILEEHNGKKFQDLTPLLQSRLEDYQIHAHVILPPTNDRIKFDIFDRVNRAGTKLNKQEIRNAIHQGKSTKVLNQIALDNIYFEKATDSAFKSETRMKDRYLILRFLAIYYYFNGSILTEDGSKYDYKSDMDDLLALTMDYINNFSDEQIDKLKNFVNNTLDKTYYYFGNSVFRLYSSNGKKSPINMNVFETIMYITANLPYNDERIVEFINSKIVNLKQDVDFLESIGNHRDSSEKLKTRIRMANDIIDAVNKNDKKN